TIVMVCVDWAVLPEASVAVQVRTNELVLPHWPFIGPSLCEIETVPQVSLPVAVPVALGAVEPVHSTMASGTSLIVGAVVSTMVMVCLQVAKLPQSSVAFQVRVMTPVLPQPGAKASVWLMATLPQASLPVAVPVALGSVEAVHSTVVLAGQVIDGLVVSTTVMVCTKLVLLPESSVAVQVREMTLVPPQPLLTMSL